MSLPEIPGVAVVHDDAGSAACGYCGNELGDDATWRESDAVVTRVTPVVDVFAGLDMRVQSRTEAPGVTLVEHFCAACAGALQVETLVEGWTSESPIGSAGVESVPVSAG
jgi:hypothetical protein